MTPDRRAAEGPPRWQRFAWFGGLWLASVLALGAVALMIRLALRL